MRNVLRVPAAAIVCAVMVMSACGGSSPQPPASGATTPAPAPPPKPALPTGPALYVSDETGGNVIVIDPAAGQVLERIAVGKRPRGIRVSRDGTQLLVALSGSAIAGPNVDESKLPPPDRSADGIGVVDLATHKLVKKYESGDDPELFDTAAIAAVEFCGVDPPSARFIAELATSASVVRGVPGIPGSARRSAVNTRPM